MSRPSSHLPVPAPATGLTRIARACGYSWRGLSAAWNNEAAFRQEIVLALLFLPPGLWLAGNGVERALLTGSLILVIVVELINSAIEAVVDRISSKRHELSGRAKDIGSAAVLLALLNALAIWGFVLFPKLF